MVERANQVGPARWPALFDKEQAAEYLSLGVRTIDRLVADQTLRPVVVRSMVRFRKIELDDYIAGLPRGDDSASVEARSPRTTSSTPKRTNKKKQTSETEAG